MESTAVEARLSGEGDDDSEAEQVTARARLRIAELLERPFDIRASFPLSTLASAHSKVTSLRLG